MRMVNQLKPQKFQLVNFVRQFVNRLLTERNNVKKSAKKPVKKAAQKVVKKVTAINLKAKKAKPKAKPAVKTAKKAAPKKKFVKAETPERMLTPMEQAPILLTALGVKSQISVDNSGEDLVHPEGNRRRNLKETFNKNTQRMIAENNRAKNKPQIVNHAVRTSVKRG